MPEFAFLLLLGTALAVYVGLPLWRRSDGPVVNDSIEPLRHRHRLALEAILDVEADRRAGSLDDEAYLAQRGAAEADAVETSRALEAAVHQVPPAPSTPTRGRIPSRRVAAGAGLALAVAVAIGFWLPAPIGFANPIVENPALADSQAAEAQRETRIDELENRLAGDARDPATLSELADLYLAGGSGEDLVRAGVVLLALIGLEPENESAYTRLITAYIRAGDYANAAAATDGFAELAPDSPDVPFFRGLIALRGEGDATTAVEEFDRFLQLAPDDPRAAMVRGLRAEAAAEAPE